MARLDVNAVGSFYFDYSHDEKSGSHRIVNFKAGRQWTNWSVYGWVRNLFDEDYYTRGFSFGLRGTKSLRTPSRTSATKIARFSCNSSIVIRAATERSASTIRRV